MPKLTKRAPSCRLSLPDYFRLKDRVLVIRRIGGFGDVVMQRMLFSDIKRHCPEIHLTFACPTKYHAAVSDHPFIDEIIESEGADTSRYGVVYDISTACHEYEMATCRKPPTKNRADIWASLIGIELEDRSLHFKISDEEKAFGKSVLKKGSRPTGGFAPISAMAVKTLLPHQIAQVVGWAKGCGFDLIGLHDKTIDLLDRSGLRTVSGLDIRQLLGVVSQLDFVVTADTAMFNIAGGLGVPMAGIFSCNDGKVIGKYFDFELIQLHRDDGWECGPCYSWQTCPKTTALPKPCQTMLAPNLLAKGLGKLENKVLRRIALL